MSEDSQAQIGSLNGVRVLVLGIHPNLSRWVLDQLVPHGVTGDNATSPEEAIAKSVEEKFDVLLVGGGMTDFQAKQAYEGMRGNLPNLGFAHNGSTPGSGPLDHVKFALANSVD